MKSYQIFLLIYELNLFIALSAPSAMIKATASDALKIAALIRGFSDGLKAESTNFSAGIRGSRPIPILTLMKSLLPMRWIMDSTPLCPPEEPFLLIFSRPISMSRSSWTTMIFSRAKGYFPRTA